MNRRTFMGAAATAAALPAPADAGRAEGDGPPKPEPDEGKIDVDMTLRLDRDGLSLQRSPWLDGTDAAADLLLEAWDDRLAVTAKRDTDDELATAGFVLDPDDAETLAALLVEFAEHARNDVDGEMFVWP